MSLIGMKRKRISKKKGKKGEKEAQSDISIQTPTPSPNPNPNLNPNPSNIAYSEVRREKEKENAREEQEEEEEEESEMREVEESLESHLFGFTKSKGKETNIFAFNENEKEEITEEIRNEQKETIQIYKIDKLGNIDGDNNKNKFINNIQTSHHHHPQPPTINLISSSSSSNSSSSSSSVGSEIANVWYDPDEMNDSFLINVENSSRLRKVRSSLSESSLTSREYSKRMTMVYSNLQHSNRWEKDIKKRMENQNDESESNKVIPIVSNDYGKNGKDDNRLEEGIINLIRLKDANQKQTATNVISSLKFHDSGELLLVSSLDSSLNLFHVDGIHNSLASHIKLQNFPIHSSSFINQGQEIIATSRRSYFYSCDIQTSQIKKIPKVAGREEKSWENMVAPHANNLNSSHTFALLGNDGYIVLIDSNTKHRVALLKMNGSVSSACYGTDGSTLYSYGSDSTIYYWDIKMMKCRDIKRDEGALHGNSIAVDQNEQYLATGQENGIVNIYTNKQNLPQTTQITQTTHIQTQIQTQTETLKSHSNKNNSPPSSSSFSSSPLPLSTLQSLRTCVTSLVFNNTSDLLLTASRYSFDSLSLYHIPSLTTIKNWPTQKTPLHRVTTAEFSPNSGYLTIGNDRGRVLLYRIKHYKQA